MDAMSDAVGQLQRRNQKLGPWVRERLPPTGLAVSGHPCRQPSIGLARDGRPSAYERVVVGCGAHKRRGANAKRDDIQFVRNQLSLSDDNPMTIMLYS